MANSSETFSPNKSNLTKILNSAETHLSYRGLE